jgi:hypothetical protein
MDSAGLEEPHETPRATAPGLLPSDGLSVVLSPVA